jgi:hypothetical protein
MLEDAAAGCLDEAFARLNSCGAPDGIVALARHSLDPSRSVRPRHAGVLAREVTAFLASEGARARAAEIAAARAQATAVSERKARRITTVLAAALGALVLAGGSLAIVAERVQRARAEQSVAEVAALYRKADWFRNTSRRIPPDQLEPWLGALAQVRRTAEIVGAGTIDVGTRRNMVRLIDELRKEEQSARERVRQYSESKRAGASAPPLPRRSDQE